MLYKFWFKNMRIVPRSMDIGLANPHTWNEEQAAFSKDAIFYDLGEAKAFAQKHTEIPLLWDDDFKNGHHSAVAGTQSAWLEFIISRDDAEIEPKELFPIPTDFRDTARDPD